MGFVYEGSGPVCLPEWKGKDNGGATYQGVTKDTIKAIALVPNDQQLAALGSRSFPTNYATGQPGTVSDALSDTLAAYDHSFGGTYTAGRHIQLEYVTSGGDDEAAQRADAVAVLDKKPFVVLDIAGSLQAFDSQIANAKTLVFSLYTSVEETLKQAPYRWGQQDNAAAMINGAEFVGKQLAGKKALYAGDASMHDKTRTLGLVVNNVLDPSYFTDTLAKYHAKVAPDATFTYSGTATSTGDAGVAQQQAPVAIAKLKPAGVTTVLLLADASMVTAMTTQATAQDYHPEWVYLGSQNIDFPLLARSYDQSQWAHAFGLANVWPGSPTAATSPPSVVQWYWGNKGTFGINHSNAIGWLVTGIMYAGPNLTPQTVKQGWFSIPAGGGSASFDPTLRNRGRPVRLRTHQQPAVRGVLAREQGLLGDLVGSRHRRTADPRLRGWPGHGVVPGQRQALRRGGLADQADDVLRQVEGDLPVRRSDGAREGGPVHRLSQRDRPRKTRRLVVMTSQSARAQQED